MTGAAAPAPAAKGQAGFSLVMVVAGITVMLILMGAAVPSWKYVMKNAREEELIFRGNQIAEAIERYQRKHGGAPPTSLDVLVKGRFLRKAWKDPVTREGKWRLVRQGEVMNQRFRRARIANRGIGDELGARADGLGGFVGVATTATDESLRIFNGQTKYDEWLFVAGQPRVVGRQPNVPGAMGTKGGRPNGPAGRGGFDPTGSQKPPGSVEPQ